MATLLSSPSLSFQNPNPKLSPNASLVHHSSPYHLRLPRYHSLSPSKTLTLRLNSPLKPPPSFKISSALLSPPPSDLLSNSTRTLSTLFSLSLSLSKLLLSSLRSLSSRLAAAASAAPTAAELSEIRCLRENLALSVGPLFFAALRDRPSGYLNTPLTVVASGMAKWLDIYSGVLMIRVLLSWFPNIPWDRQPLSAIRDLCDPYLNLFRNIIPPIFDTLDVSPLLAFAVLGTLGSILHSSRGVR